MAGLIVLFIVINSLLAFRMKQAYADIWQQLGISKNKGEENIRESEEKFRTLAETLPQLIWITDEKGTQEYASKRWKDYTGLEPKDESTWSQMIHPDDIAGINSTWLNCLQTGDAYQAEVRLKNAGECCAEKYLPFSS